MSNLDCSQMCRIYSRLNKFNLVDFNNVAITWIATTILYLAIMTGSGIYFFRNKQLYLATCVNFR